MKTTIATVEDTEETKGQNRLQNYKGTQTKGHNRNTKDHEARNEDSSGLRNQLQSWRKDTKDQNY